MVDVKVVIADPKTGKCYQKELKESDASSLYGLKIRDKVDGKLFELEGYELEITGGSDSAGFPMRRDVEGAARKRILAVEGVGVKKKGKGIKQRKTVAGNTVHKDTAQINLKVVKYGKKPIAEEPKEEEKAENEGKAKE